MALAIILAWLTYLLIERPIRLGPSSVGKIGLLLSCMVAIGGAGYLTYRDDGFPFRANATLKDFEGDIGHYAFHKYVSGYIICLHAGQHRERSSDMGRILALSPVKIKARH
ncbi:MAG TPA: hypothetical protein VNY32_04520 [Candidatus Acidoferrales bacterium]|nr:hypothetical protein [Candidatus Acidoferrales bacterium]